MSYANPVHKVRPNAPARNTMDVDEAQVVSDLFAGLTPREIALRHNVNVAVMGNYISRHQTRWQYERRIAGLRDDTRRRVVTGRDGTPLSLPRISFQDKPYREETQHA